MTCCIAPLNTFMALVQGGTAVACTELSLKVLQILNNSFALVDAMNEPLSHRVWNVNTSALPHIERI